MQHRIGRDLDDIRLDAAEVLRIGVTWQLRHERGSESPRDRDDACRVAARVEPFERAQRPRAVVADGKVRLGHAVPVVDLDGMLIRRHAQSLGRARRRLDASTFGRNGIGLRGFSSGGTYTTG